MGSSRLFVDDRTGGDRSTLPVVIVHGAPDRSRNFAAVIAELGDLPIITYDRRGYGMSVDVAPPARDFDDHADDLIEILDGRRAVVCAQSVGCNVAMTTATRAPHLVAALGVWEPPNAWCDWWPSPAMYEAAAQIAAATDTEAMAEAFNRQTIGDARWESLPDRTRQMLRAEGAAFKADMVAELTAPFDFADIKCPTVIGVGTNTIGGHYPGAFRLAEILAADVYVVRGADHFCPLTNPPAWAEMVRRAYALATRTAAAR